MSPQTLSRMSLFIGVLLALLALFGDPLSGLFAFAYTEGFGALQVIGLLIGILLAATGAYFGFVEEEETPRDTA